MKAQQRMESSAQLNGSLIRCFDLLSSAWSFPFFDLHLHVPFQVFTFLWMVLSMILLLSAWSFPCFYFHLRGPFHVFTFIYMVLSMFLLSFAWSFPCFHFHLHGPFHVLINFYPHGQVLLCLYILYCIYMHVPFLILLSLHSPSPRHVFFYCLS